MGKKTMKNSEEKPSRHKIHAVASGQRKQETSRRLTSRQKLEVHLNESVNYIKEEDYRQQELAKKLVKFPINFELVPSGQLKEVGNLFRETLVSIRENKSVLGPLSDKLLDKLGPPFGKFVTRLVRNIWFKVHLRCLQEVAGVSDEEMAEMHPLHQLKLLDGVNNTHTPSRERMMKVLASEFGLHTPDIITELAEKMVKAFAEVAPEETMTVFKTVAYEREMVLARKLVKTPINFSLVPPDQWEEVDRFFQKMIDSARENMPLLRLLADKLMEKLGLPYGGLVARLLRNIWLKVHWRCLQEDACVSDEEMAEMHPLHQLKLMDGVNNTHPPSPERSMKVLATEFGLHTPDIITELVEKIVKAYAEVAPEEIFEEVAHERQTVLASKLVKIPINFVLVPLDQREEMYHLSQKMIDSARENMPVLRLLADKLLDKLGLSYGSFVACLLKNILLKVHWRCLQEDACVSDEEMAEMHPLYQLKLLNGVNNTHTPSQERSMKVLASEFGLHTPDVVPELAEKMVKAFAEVAPDDFAKIAREDAMVQALALVVRGISLASQ